jgi:predicted membrane protein (TIGR00267 family)
MKSGFVRGLIDGLLSTLGIVIGASSAQTMIIVAAGLGGAFANGVSNVLGAYAAEATEGYSELKKIEKAMVKSNLKETLIEKRLRNNIAKAGLIDGVATIIGGCMPVIPFLIFNHVIAVISAVIIVFIIMLLIGIFIGKLSKRNLIVSGLKLAIFGILTAIAVYIMQFVIISR